MMHSSSDSNDSTDSSEAWKKVCATVPHTMYFLVDFVVGPHNAYEAGPIGIEVIVTQEPTCWQPGMSMIYVYLSCPTPLFISLEISFD